MKYSQKLEMDAFRRKATSENSQSQRLLPLPPLDTRPAMSAKYVQESMRLSQAENLWRCMHSETYPEAALLEGHIRAQTMGIPSLSSLTQRANQKLELHKPLEHGLTKSMSGGLNSPTSNRLPSDSDFKRAMEKLGRIYAQGGVDSLKIALQEGKSHELLLDAEDKMFARISLQGQLCPLVVLISRSRGRLVTYTSKTVQEPMEMLCDSKITGDRIWLSDAGVRFKASMLYISFVALEEATFSVTVQFGQKKRAAKEKWKAEALSAGEDEWERLFGTFEERKPKFTKNFVSLNRNVARLDSPESISYQLEKLTTIDMRRKEAVKRWHEQLARKKKRALDLLNRQQLKEIERQKQLRIAKEKAAIEAIKQKWLVITWSLKTFDCLLLRFSQRKAEIAVENRRIAAIRKIQRAYRRHTKHSSRHQLAMIRASFNFRFAFRPYLEIDRPLILQSLKEVIAASAKLASVPIKFRSFLHAVALIQRIWKQVRERDKQLREQLGALWNQTMAAAISAASKKKPAVVRGKKVKENPTMRYLNITSVTKNQVISAYFQTAKRKLKADCRAYVQLRKSGASNLITPTFQCLPSSDEMLKIIEKAADSALQTVE